MATRGSTQGSRSRKPFGRLYTSELRLSLRINAGAYGYSVMITSTLAMVSAIHAQPEPEQVLLFIVGAVGSFAVIETAITRGFKRKPSDQESAEVVALGSSLSLVSIASAVGVTWLAAAALPEGAAWILCPFAASLTYIGLLGVEMSMARRIEESRHREGRAQP
ncbi:hypothetical protein [Phytoactinopolyspora halotolerans]|uniref:Uncharacterized protein n=1 Tax=Phytoactinopolyspora halotolerans TaxID=1981512 RepID=A0A6L9S2Y7_9ACTN|nr:hypothetical protein [Phytoactinopolyspora halotolerans]NED99190.1 hypothetical protein [Phytoactinopolyspora halotolerans]